MEWSDQAIVLAARAHGENAVILSVLSEAHGRHSGLVRGGQGKRLSGVLQPGNEVKCVWRARLAEHLGSFTVEPLRAHTALFLDDAKKLAAMASACALLDGALAEREEHLALYRAFLALLDALENSEHWPEVYVRFEIGLLQELGFALDFSSCAATGSTEDLIYVSPRSAQAVSAAAGEPYKDKLLPLPGFLIGRSEAPSLENIRAGLRLAGYFLDQGVFHHKNQHLPVARTRLLELFSR